jgi:hypothetical protein
VNDEGGQTWEKKFGVVAMLDALGGRVFNIEETQRFLERRQKFLDDPDLKKTFQQMCRYATERKTEPPRLFTFQDSIILHWNVGSTNFKKYPEFVLPQIGAWLVNSIVTGLIVGFPTRGAVAIGEYVQDATSLLGPAVSDAAAWYEKADWFGVIATPACGHRISHLAEFFDLKKRPLDDKNVSSWFFRYKVPLTGGNFARMWAVSWPRCLCVISSGQQYTPRWSLFNTLAQFPVPPGTENKYANTIRFFDTYMRLRVNAAPAAKGNN